MSLSFSRLLFLSIVCIFLQLYSANVQLTGTKNIPGDYADLALAITDLNTQGVGAGGVILNLVAGNPQTAPAGGYSILALFIHLSGSINRFRENSVLTSLMVTLA